MTDEDLDEQPMVVNLADKEQFDLFVKHMDRLLAIQTGRGEVYRKEYAALLVQYAKERGNRKIEVDTRALLLAAEVIVNRQVEAEAHLLSLVETARSMQDLLHERRILQASRQTNWGHTKGEG